MHNSDHFMVMGYLRGASPMEHLRYLEQRTGLPLRLPGRQTMTQVDKISTKLRRAVPKPDKREAHHNLWILEETWRLVDKRFSARQEPGWDQTRLRRMRRAISAALNEYRRRQVETAGEDIKWLLFGNPSPPPRSTAEDEGLVQSGGGICPSAHLNHTREYHGGVRGNLLIRTPTRREHPHVCDDFPHRRLHT